MRFLQGGQEIIVYNPDSLVSNYLIARHLISPINISNISIIYKYER